MFGQYNSQFSTKRTPLKKKEKKIFSEGGTGEDWRIDPHLNLGNFRVNNNKIWKKLVQILT